MQLIILTVKYFTLGICIISTYLIQHQVHSKTLSSPLLLKQSDLPVILSDDETLINSVELEAEERLLFLPPAFPYAAPYGYFGSAIFCKILVGPLSPFAWNRACAGPVPPFRKPKTPVEPEASEEEVEDKYNYRQLPSSSS